MAALPISDDYPARRAPVVTYLLIAANVVVYLITPVAALLDRYGVGATRECAQVIFLYEWAAIPRELLSGHQIPFHELQSGIVPGPCLGQLHPFHKVVWLTPVWAMFLHGGVAHILGNMLYLYVFGTRVEDRMGHLRYLVAYLAFGYISAYGFALTSPGADTPLVGASGAIAGVLGTYLLINPRGRVLGTIFYIIPIRMPAWVLLGSWFVLQYLSLRADSQDGTAYAAHVYGFIAGMLLGLVLRRSRNAYGTGALFAWR
ncbi:MAG TPA: rhomboid family intramembrane serine protease [Streptosporangiaceae bacterium]|jgi:membrane associated rhomboid family serine protease